MEWNGGRRLTGDGLRQHKQTKRKKRERGKEGRRRKRCSKGGRPYDDNRAEGKVCLRTFTMLKLGMNVLVPIISDSFSFTMQHLGEMAQLDTSDV